MGTRRIGPCPHRGLWGSSALPQHGGWGVGQVAYTCGIQRIARACSPTCSSVLLALRESSQPTGPLCPPTGGTRLQLPTELQPPQPQSQIAGIMPRTASREHVWEGAAVCYFLPHCESLFFPNVRTPVTRHQPVPHPQPCSVCGPWLRVGLSKPECVSV